MTGNSASTGGNTVFSTAGSTLQLGATVTPANAVQTVTWTSSNTAAATVSSTGIVTAVGNGFTTVTAAATDGSGVTGTTTVNVSGLPSIAYFISQGSVTSSSATVSGGTISISSASSSGSAFAYTATNSPVTFTNANVSYLVFPSTMGAYSETATVSVGSMSQTSNASGIGIGEFSGMTPQDSYGMSLIRNGSTAPTSYTLYYCKGTSVGTSSTGAVTSGLALNTPYTINMARGEPPAATPCIGWMEPPRPAPNPRATAPPVPATS